MKLRVHYRYGYGKVRRKDFEEFHGDLMPFQEEVASHRRSDGMVNFTSVNSKGFSVPARDIVLMEVID